MEGIRPDSQWPAVQQNRGLLELREEHGLIESDAEFNTLPLWPIDRSPILDLIQSQSGEHFHESPSAVPTVDSSDAGEARAVDMQNEGDAVAMKNRPSMPLVARYGVASSAKLLAFLLFLVNGPCVAESSPTLANPFFFFHVQKTGGTSVRGELAAHGVSGVHFIPCFHNVNCLCSYDLFKPVCSSRYACATLFAGHFLPYRIIRDLGNSSNLSDRKCSRPGWTAEMTDANVLSHLSRDNCLIVLRDPLERLISHFYFFSLRRLPRDTCSGAVNESVLGQITACRKIPHDFHEFVAQFSAAEAVRLTGGNFITHALSQGCCGASGDREILNDETQKVWTAPLDPLYDTGSRTFVSKAERPEKQAAAQAAARAVIDRCTIGFSDDLSAALASLPPSLNVRNSTTHHDNPSHKPTISSTVLPRAVLADFRQLLASDYSLVDYAKSVQKARY